MGELEVIPDRPSLETASDGGRAPALTSHDFFIEVRTLKDRFID
jgi:hypothetical protein